MSEPKSFREMIAKLAGHSPDLKPFEGKATNPPRSIQEIAAAVGIAARDEPLGADLALCSCAKIMGRAGYIKGRMYLWASKWLRETGRNMNHARLCWVVFEVFNDVTSGGRHDSALKAKDAGMRKEDYLRDVSPLYFALRRWAEDRESYAITLAAKAYKNSGDEHQNPCGNREKQGIM